MRDRLIELLKGAENKVAEGWTRPLALEEWLGIYADHLIANGVILLPCKENTTVYEIIKNGDACKDCPDYSHFYGMDAMCSKEGIDIDDAMYPEYAEKIICDKQFYEIKERKADIEYIFNVRKVFGKTVFLTKEDAENALKEKSNGN